MGDEMSMDDLIRLKPKYPNQELNVVIPLGVSVTTFICLNVVEGL